MLSLFQTQWLQAKRQPALWLTPLVFFVMAAVAFPLAIGTDSHLLQTIAPGILWVLTLLASLLSLQDLFRSDYLDGTTEQLILSPKPLPILLAKKIFSHWLLHGLPLVLLTPLLGLFYQLHGDTDILLMLTLLLGTPALSYLGAIGCALTVSLRGNGFLLPVLIFPLFIPILILATSTLHVYQMGLPINPFIALMVSILIISLIISPIISAAALRIGAAT